MSHATIQKRLLAKVLSSSTIIAMIVLVLLCGLFFWRTLTPVDGDRQIFPPGDFTVEFYPLSNYQVGRINQGQFPTWSPYNFSGTPFAAELQTAAWYPLRWIAALSLGTDTGWGMEDLQLEVVFHYLLTSVMTYFFLRLLVKKSLPALIGSVIFSYGGYLTAYPMLQVSVLESITWLPLMLIGANISVHKPGWAIHGGSLMGMAIGISFFAGHIQTTMQATYVALAYFAFAGYQAELKWHVLGKRMIWALVVGAGISMIQFLPSMEFTNLSTRLDLYNYADKSTGFSFQELSHIVWPRLSGEWIPLYVGAAGLLLAVGALSRPKAKHRFWGFVVVVALFLTVGNNSIVYDFFYLLVPGFGMFRLQEHMAFAFSFAMAVLATYQLAWLMNNPDTANDKERWATGIYLGISIAGLLLLDTSGISITVDALVFVIFMIVLFGAWQLSQKTTFVVGLLLVLIVVDLFSINTRSNNFLSDIPANHISPPPMLEQLQITEWSDMTGRVDGAAGLHAYNMYWRIPDIYGMSPFHLDSIKMLRQLPVHLRWEVFSVQYTLLTEEPPGFVPLDLIAYGRNDLGEEYKVFEFLDPRPMAHLVYDYRNTDDNPEFARQIMTDERVNLREMAITLQPLPFELPGERPELSSVDDFEMVSPEKMTMTVSTETEALLTISMPKYPGWKAYVDDQRVEIIDVYAGLIGIPLQAGEKQAVRVEFISDSLRLGAAITGLTLILVAGVTITAIVQQKKQESQAKITSAP